MSARVPVYFSHSYRREDRDLNDYFWTIFHGAGFSFTVDPGSTLLSTTYLELMMARSAGFVAVVTYRQEEEGYRCSPFIMHEYGLAVRARKPRLVLRDWRVSPHWFPAGAEVVEFHPEAYDRAAEPLLAKIQAFHARTSPYAAGVYHRAGRVGLALSTGTDEASRRREILDRILRRTGDDAVSLTEKADDPFELALAVDSCDFVIIDLDAPGVTQIADFLSGRATPTLKWCHQHPETGSHPLRLLGGAPLRRAAAADELVLYWSDHDELEARTFNEIGRLTDPRREFVSLEEGHKYFRSLGRATMPVFLSNAGETNVLAQALSRALGLENIPYFHYRSRNSIDLGEDFADRLWEKVRASAVFVPLIDKSYWKSSWCTEEFNLATKLARERRLRVVPYFLEETDSGPKVSMQGRFLGGLPETEQVQIIVRDLDRLLAEPDSRTAKITTVSGREAAVRAGEINADIAVITILPEEYGAVLRLLSSRRTVVGTDTFPNVHSWEVGEIKSPLHERPYVVVLALCPGPGTNAAVLATKNTLLAFDPRHVLVVGVAGGLRDVDLGDVVVADRICGYEYGKIDHGFHPRHDHDYPADAPIVGAARTLPHREPAWYGDLGHPESLRDLTPKILVGSVASGDKVVDDRSDAFFESVLKSRPKLMAVEMEGAGVAAAIQDARELNRPVGFAMIRGISDIPADDLSAGGRNLNASEQTQMRDAWKERASAAAAACAVQLVRLAWPRPPREQSPNEQQQS